MSFKEKKDEASNTDVFDINASKLWCPIPSFGGEKSPGRPVDEELPLVAYPVVARHGPREEEGGVAVVRVGGGLDGGPRHLVPVVPPVGQGDGHAAGGEHGADVVEDGAEAGAQAAVGVELVDLVAGALLEGGEELLDVERGRVGDGVEGAGAEVDEGGEAPGHEEAERLAQLEGVAGRARVVAELALALARRVELEEVPLDRGDGVEDALAPEPEFVWGNLKSVFFFNMRVIKCKGG